MEETLILTRPTFCLLQLQQFMLLEQLQWQHHQFAHERGGPVWKKRRASSSSGTSQPMEIGQLGVRELLTRKPNPQPAAVKAEPNTNTGSSPPSGPPLTPGHLVLPSSPTRPPSGERGGSHDSFGDSGGRDSGAMSLNQWVGQPSASTPQSTVSARHHSAGGDLPLPTDKKQRTSNLSLTTHPEAAAGPPAPQQEGRVDVSMEGQGQRPAGDSFPVYFGGDDPPAEFSDAEELILGLPATAPCEAGERHAAWLEEHLEDLQQLEVLASCTTEQDLEAEGSLACLSGRTGRYLCKRVVVSLGRSTETKGEVDIDLSREGPSHAVSRRQAYISLKADGHFHICNTGRQGMCVNDTPLLQFQSVQLPHLSLLEVGNLRFLFLVNRAAVDRVLRRTAKLVM